MLTNYLQVNRKRASLSQEEVAFLLGVTGPRKDLKVLRDEQGSRVPTLEAALAYEAIYGKPLREIFAGMYEGIEQQVAARAKILKQRKEAIVKNNRRHALDAISLSTAHA